MVPKIRPISGNTILNGVFILVLAQMYLALSRTVLVMCDHLSARITVTLLGIFNFSTLYKSWSVGYHGNHQALVQVAPIQVCRDFNKDFTRVGDSVDVGLFGVNQHWGGDASVIGKWSAGCLVGQSIKGHQEFMKLVKQDARYEADKNYVFWTTVIAGDDLSNA